MDRTYLAKYNLILYISGEYIFQAREKILEQYELFSATNDKTALLKAREKENSICSLELLVATREIFKR